MKLSSRPEDEDELAVQNFDSDELELICAYLYCTILGTGTAYSKAAFSLLHKIENVYGEDFVDQASRRVDMHAIKLDQITMRKVEILDGGEFELVV